MYQTTKLGHTYDFTEEEFCPLSVCDAREAEQHLEDTFDDEWDQWKDTTRCYFDDYSPLIDGEVALVLFRFSFYITFHGFTATIYA